MYKLLSCVLCLVFMSLTATPTICAIMENDAANTIVIPIPEDDPEFDDTFDWLCHDTGSCQLSFTNAVIQLPVVNYLEVATFFKTVIFSPPELKYHNLLISL